jgi:hypothetical protein
VTSWVRKEQRVPKLNAFVYLHFVLAVGSLSFDLMSVSHSFCTVACMLGFQLVSLYCELH